MGQVSKEEEVRGQLGIAMCKLLYVRVYAWTAGIKGRPFMDITLPQ